jgi:WhiB family transcriptional regulator, redox-sensing transcriptional regulator
MTQQRESRRSLALAVGAVPTDWHQDARCRDESHFIFFAGRGFGKGYEAKQVCGRCPVIDRCLEYALETRQRFGIWGGLNVK